MTKLVEWSEELSVGIAEIDDQHKKLVDMLNRMNDAIHEHRGSEVTRPILNEIAEYTRVHFTTEESLMRATNYPEYEEHKRQHDELIAQVKDLQAKLDAGSHAISFELMHFLKVWLTKHIMESDKQYGPYFLDRGIVEPAKPSSWWSRFWGSRQH
jgi:hemerythrin